MSSTSAAGPTVMRLLWREDSRDRAVAALVRAASEAAARQHTEPVAAR